LSNVTQIKDDQSIKIKNWVTLVKFPQLSMANQNGGNKTAIGSRPLRAYGLVLKQ